MRVNAGFNSGAKRANRLHGDIIMREKVAFGKIQRLCCSDATRLIPTGKKLGVGR